MLLLETQHLCGGAHGLGEPLRLVSPVSFPCESSLTVQSVESVFREWLWEGQGFAKAGRQKLVSCGMKIK